MERYQLKFRLENIPGASTMYAGQTDAYSPTDAGKALESTLKARITAANFRNLAEASIVDSDGKECAVLQIRKDGKTNTYQPVWGSWLKVFGKA